MSRATASTAAPSAEAPPVPRRGPRRAWVQAGGRFHFDQLVEELERRGRLAAARTARRRQVDLARVDTQRALAWSRAAHRFSPLERLRSSSTVWDPIFDAAAGRALARWLAGQPDPQGQLLFHGFAAYSLKSMAVARRHGLPTILDTGSAHIEEQRRLARAAYQAAGARPRVFPAAWVEHQMEEYEAADVILVGSSFAARSFAGTGLEAKVNIVRYGVDATRFAGKAHYATDRPLRVGFVGNVNPEKGVHLLTEAVSSLGRDVTLHMAGRIPFELKRWWRGFAAVVERHHSHLEGDDLVAFYQSLDVLVLPSCQDGFGLAAAEAMACGTPCLVTSNAGVADIVEDGRTGRVVAPHDPRALEEGLRWFAEDRERIAASGSAAREALVARTWAAYADEVAQIYEALDG